MLNINQKLNEQNGHYSNRYENEDEIDINKKEDINIKDENNIEHINNMKLYSENKDNNDNVNVNDNEKEEELNIKEYNNNNNLKSNNKTKPLSKNNEDINSDDNENDNDNISIDKNNKNKNIKNSRKKSKDDDNEDENQPLSASKKNKNSKSKYRRESPYSNSKTKYKIPISGELLFNPKQSKRKSFRPLFTKYEVLEFNNRKRFSAIPSGNESVFKKAKEIFPSKYGFEMPYRSQLRQSNYSVYSSRTLDKSNRKKTVSEKKRKTDIRNNDEASIKEFDFNAKSEHIIIKRYGRKNYYMYKSPIKSNNPFVGVSRYAKNLKQRRNLIAKAVEKEGNQFNEIISLEENIIKNRELNEKELNQLIITLTKFIYDDNDKNLENKESYEFKINKVSNIIKFMNEENQNKIMEQLRNNAKDDYSNEIFEILKAKIDDYKEKLVKVYKIDEDSKKVEKDSKRNSPMKKSFKKFTKITK